MKLFSIILFLILIILAANIGLDGDAFSRISAICLYIIGGTGCAVVLLYKPRSLNLSYHASTSKHNSKRQWKF